MRECACGFQYTRCVCLISWMFWLLLLLLLLFHAIPMFVAVRVVSVSCLQASHKIMYFFYSFRPFVRMEAHEATRQRYLYMHACMHTRARVCVLRLFVCWLFTVRTLNRRWLYLFLSAHTRTHGNGKRIRIDQPAVFTLFEMNCCMYLVYELYATLCYFYLTLCIFLFRSVVMVRMREGNFDTGWTTAHDNCHLNEQL